MTTSSTSPPSFADAAHRLGATPVEAYWSGRTDGDQRRVGSATVPPGVPAGLSVYRLHQVHGDAVVVADAPPPPGCGPWVADADGRPTEADALVAVGPRSCAVVLTADCAPVALGSPEGVHGAVHVGWRGLRAGVLARAVEAMAALGASTVVAGLGPTIHRCCYAFGPADLDALAAVVGEGVRGTTAGGEPALDLPAAVRAQLARAGARLMVDVDRCTACGPDGFSHRARQDEARQGLFVWSVARPSSS